MTHTNPFRRSCESSQLRFAENSVAFRLRIVAFLVVTTLVLLPNPLQAADCGCEPVGCDSVGCDFGCDGPQAACPPKPGPIYRTLDALAGGIEKVLGLDKCPPRQAIRCNSATCTHGCSAAMYGGHSLVVPMPPMPMQPLTAQPMVPHRVPGKTDSMDRHPSPPMPRAVESNQVKSHPIDPPSTNVVPRSPIQMGQPQIKATPLHSGMPHAAPVPRPEPLQNMRPTSEPRPDNDSLFDALSDPFDDDARIQRSQAVRRTNHDAVSSRRTHGRLDR